MCFPRPLFNTTLRSVSSHPSGHVCRLTHDAANVYTELAYQASIDEPVLPVRLHALVLARNEPHDDRGKGKEECHDSSCHHLVANIVCHSGDVRHLGRAPNEIESPDNAFAKPEHKAGVRCRIEETKRRER